MKNVINTLAAIGMTVMSLLSVNAQEGVIWTRIPGAGQYGLTSTANGVESNSAVINRLVSEYNITKMFKAVPSSRNAYLQDLYQIECNCDEISLLQAVAKESAIFSGPEHGPRYETLGTPNDYSLAVSYDYALELINATEAWELTTGDENIIISITDAGYDMGIVELNGKIASISTGITNSNVSHGTAVATTAAGSTNNAFGKSSIGYNSRLDLRGMNYNELLSAAYSGARVINASWAAGCYYSTYGQMIVDEVHAAGVIIVAAAGNGSTCNDASALVYPASYSKVISVTSIGAADNHEGTPGNPYSTHQHNAMVDICAPGYGVALALPGNGFTTGNGSSFAAPYVSGTIALMLAANPCLTYENVDYILKASADTNVYAVNPSVYNGLLGAGRLDAHKAVEMAIQFSTIPGSISHEVVCEFNEQVLFLDSVGGVGPYEIVWSNGETTSMCPVGATGTYSVMVKDSLGCRFYEEMEVLPVTPIAIQGDIEPVACSNTEDGKIFLTVSGGSGSYSVEWSNGMEGMEISGLGAGNYQVFVTDDNGCQSSEYFTMTAPEALNLDLEIVHASPFGGGSVSAEVSGGTGEYSFQWTNGATTTEIMDLEPGMYQVTVKDENHCSAVKLAIVQYQNTAGLEAEELVSLNVYPNPATEHLTVQLSDNAEYTVAMFDAQGKVVYEQSGLVMAHTIAVNEMERGAYLLKVVKENGETATRRVIVQ